MIEPIVPSSSRAGTVAAALERVTAGWEGVNQWLAPLPTGFQPLDSVLDGGLRAQDLVLVGGRPGVGKTVATLQWARSAAIAGRPAVFACYEHSEMVLLTRLLALEVGTLAGPDDVYTVEKLRPLLRQLMSGGRNSEELISRYPLFGEAYARLHSYAHRLWIIRGSPAHTGVAELEQLVQHQVHDRPVLFVDYLQKVPLQRANFDEEERVTRIVTGLKDLALTCQIPVVAIVAADHRGLTSRRMGLHNLRGSTALAHESDVVLVLNQKWHAVSKTHLAYDPVRARTFRQYIVFSVEKNRDGPALVDLQFRHDFPSYRFDPQGSFVEERLVDDRGYEE